MDNNRIKVNIFVAGQRFSIITDKSEKYVLDIASQIDARINSLVYSQNMSRERAAVLTALDYADDSQLDKENITAVKEQIKDYLQEIERLQDNSAKLVSDYNKLKAEYERLIEVRSELEEAQKALADSRAEIDSLKEQLEKKNKRLTAMENAQKELAESKTHIAALQKDLKLMEERIESFRQQETEPSVPEKEEEAPLPEEPPIQEERPITAADDLFFDPEEEEPVKPDKKKKNRHNHDHVNPYQQKAKEKEQKGYTQQRQYSFFELNED